VSVERLDGGSRDRRCWTVVRTVITYDEGTAMGILLPGKRDTAKVDEIVRATVGYRPRTDDWELVHDDAA